MKVVIYCQHVLGVGHFFRTLEIARAMKAWDVVLVTGGGAVPALLPGHIRHVALPGLMMDKDFTRLYSTTPRKHLDDVKQERKEKLLALIKREKPDLFLIELYPFGRNAFRFELIPVLAYIKGAPETTCKVVCSLRDILVEKENPQKYETRVIDALNKWFDAVLVHSDPDLIRLDTTFSRLDQIRIPVFYTGFVTPLPDLNKAEQIRKEIIGPDPGRRLVVASIGGGNVGIELLKALVRAYPALPSKKNIRLNIYTGPYMDARDKHALKSFACDSIKLAEFTHDFVSVLKACDLSVSMAGYNTCMNIAAAGVPSLVWPFNQNREQRARAEKLSRFAAPMTILDDQDLAPDILARHIEANLNRQIGKPGITLNIHGARNTVTRIKEVTGR